MAGIAKVHIIGNVTRDAEKSDLPSGVSVAKFGVAVNQDYKNKAGEKVEKVSFFDVEVWNMGNSRQADVAAQYLTKGKPVYVEGDLEQQTWEDKNGGGKRSKVVVKCTRFQMIGSKKDAEGEGGGDEAPRQKAPPPPRNKPAQRSYAPADDGTPDFGGEDDIPF